MHVVESTTKLSWSLTFGLLELPIEIGEILIAHLICNQ